MLTVKLEKDGEIVGYIEFKEDSVIFNRPGGRIGRPILKVDFDKASPNIAKTKEGDPLFVGDVIIEQHHTWWDTGYLLGWGEERFRLDPTGKKLIGHQYKGEGE